MNRALRVCAASAAGLLSLPLLATGLMDPPPAESIDDALVAELRDRLARDAGDADAARLLMGLRTAAAPGPSPASRGAIGPDIIVGAIPGAVRTGKAVVGTDLITGYAVGTTSCNIGDANADWYSATVEHPVIIQNLFRLKNGRFEQIAVSWAKHGFLVIPESLCGVCTATTSSFELIPGCADTYSTSTNSMSSRLGPRAQVNASTGVNVGPAPPSASLPLTIRGMMQAKEADVDPAQNAGARYFAEAAYIAADDTAAGNQLNNWSFREVVITGSMATQNYPMNLAAGSSTQVSRIGLEAWRDVDAAVTIATADVPGDGRYALASRVYDNGDGTWTYQYALYNMNSDRSAGRFEIPLAGASAGAPEFRDVFYHSGDGVAGVNYDGTDWPATVSSSSIAWECTPFATSANSNALRFGTLYAFRFTSDRPPTASNATVGLFKPGGMADPTTFSIGAQIPGATPCPADLSGDGLVNSVDLTQLLGAWGGPSAADLNNDGLTNSVDLTQLLGAWGPCP
jgi:hypothetical protein